MISQNDILNFWFQEIDSKRHWVKDSEFDALIRKRFSSVHQAASECELFAWRVTSEGRLAEIIILDQFSRNMFRDTPQAFAQDSLALALAQEAVANAADKEMDEYKRSFLYMPYMHSESRLVHVEAEKLFKPLGNYEFELKHKAIIDRFGRYPHRNEILKRESTSEEIEFLQQPGSSF